MVDAALRAALMAEKVRTYWDFQARQLEMHERRYLQLLAVTSGAALAVLASVLLERVPAAQGMALTLLLPAVVAALEVRIARLPSKLRQASYATTVYNDKTMALEEH